MNFLAMFELLEATRYCQNSEWKESAGNCSSSQVRTFPGNFNLSVESSGKPSYVSKKFFEWKFSTSGLLLNFLCLSPITTHFKTGVKGFRVDITKSTRRKWVVNGVPESN